MSANLSAAPKLQFFDNNGNPLVGGKLYTYAAGTTTPQVTYTDASATTPNTNPIILDSRGEANVWLSATTYKFVLTDAADATIWTVDNISNSLSLSQILAASGSAASPPYTFASDTDTGMYLAAVGQLGLSVAGTPVLRSTDTQMVIGQSGGSNDVDVVVYGDIDTEGAFNLDGNLNITGAARRITGDFSNATVANRVAFQTSTVNSFTAVEFIPNGTGTSSFLTTYGASDPSNAAYFGHWMTGTDSRLDSGKSGTGTFLPMTFYTGGSERMRIDASGNVGIGTNSPTVALDVFRSGDAVQIQASNGTVGQRVAYCAFGNAYSGSSSNHPYVLLVNDLERMRIDTSGNVGIGTTNISGKFNVGSGRSFFGANSEIYSIGVGYTQARVNAGQAYYIGATDSATPALVFSNAAGTEQMRITAAGNVGIGTTGPGSKLEVVDGACIVSAVSTAGATTFQATSSGTNPAYMIFANGSVGAERARITGTNASSLVFAVGPATTSVAAVTLAGNFQFNSGYGSVATAYGCRAWINFDGTSGSIGAGRGSGNVSSVTDNGAGDYTINFTTAMPDANYAVTGTANGRNTHPARVVGAGYSGDTFSTSAVQIRTGTAGGSGANGTTEDCEYVFVAIFR